MPGKAPTLKDIAEKAGVSSMAVSLALRGDPRIPTRTQTRIRNIAEAMGWRPNPTLSRMMTDLRKQNQDELREQVAVLTAEPVEQQKTDLFLQPLNQGVHERPQTRWRHAHPALRGEA